jgi:hypothetical protein
MSTTKVTGREFNNFVVLISYSNEHNTKLTGRENLKKNTFCVGPVGTTVLTGKIK